MGTLIPSRMPSAFCRVCPDGSPSRPRPRSLPRRAACMRRRRRPKPSSRRQRTGGLIQNQAEKKESDASSLDAPILRLDSTHAPLALWIGCVDHLLTSATACRLPSKHQQACAEAHPHVFFVGGRGRLVPFCVVQIYALKRVAIRLASPTGFEPVLTAQSRQYPALKRDAAPSGTTPFQILACRTLACGCSP